MCGEQSHVRPLLNKWIILALGHPAVAADEISEGTDEEGEDEDEEYVDDEKDNKVGGGELDDRAPG